MSRLKTRKKRRAGFGPQRSDKPSAARTRGAPAKTVTGIDNVPEYFLKKKLAKNTVLDYI